MSKLERVLRLVLAVVIFALGFFYGSWWGLIGLIPLVTGVFGVCPLRVLMGKQECPLGVCPLSKKGKNKA